MSNQIAFFGLGVLFGFIISWAMVTFARFVDLEEPTEREKLSREVMLLEMKLKKVKLEEELRGWQRPQQAAPKKL